MSRHSPRREVGGEGEASLTKWIEHAKKQRHGNAGGCFRSKGGLV